MGEKEVFEMIFYFILMYLIMYYIPCTESEKCYDAGNEIQSSTANTLGPRACRHFTTEFAKDPHEGTQNSSMITTTLALSGAGPAVFVVIFVPLADCTPYTKVGKRATYIQNRMSRKRIQNRDAIIYSHSDECAELSKIIFDSNGIGIRDTLDVLERTFTEA